MIALQCYSCGLFWIQLGNDLICHRCRSDIVEIIDSNYDGMLQPAPIAQNIQNQAVHEQVPQNAMPQQQSVPQAMQNNRPNPVQQPQLLPNIPVAVPQVQRPINIPQYSHPSRNRTRRNICNCGRNCLNSVQRDRFPPIPPVPQIQVPIFNIPAPQVDNVVQSRPENPAPNPIIPRQPQNVNSTNMASLPTSLQEATASTVNQNASQSTVSSVSSLTRLLNMTTQRINGNMLISLNNGNPVPNATVTSNNHPTNSGASTSATNQQSLPRTASRRRSRSLQEGPAEKRSRSRSMTNYEMARIERIPKSRLKEGEEECGICYDSFDGRKLIRRLKCNHTYHQTCIFGWLKKDPTCPFCRYNLVDDDENTGRGQT